MNLLNWKRETADARAIEMSKDFGLFPLREKRASYMFLIFPSHG